MRLSITLVLILSIITHGYSDPKKPKKPKTCTPKDCSDWDYKHGKGLFDPHTIKWPLHYTGDIYKDYVDGGNIDIEVVFNHYGHLGRKPLKDYRNSTYHPDPWFLDKGIKMHDPFYCEEWTTEEPRWKSNYCSLVASTFEDIPVYFDGPSCSKIVRNWTVVDWCKWEPNTIANSKDEKYVLVKDLVSHEIYFSYGSGHHDIEHDGWYTWQQVIKILDKDKPKIKNCEPIEFDLEGECEAKVKIKNRAVDTGPCPGEKLTVELKVYDKEGFVVLSKWLNAWHDDDFWVNLGYLKAGDYLIHWTVQDGCKNTGGCTQKLKVIDKNPPHLICIQDLGSSISDEHGVTIWAKDFVHKVEGPCYDNNLTYSFFKDTVVSSLHFNCPDGIGLNELEVFVTAGNGVSASCNTTFFVRDNAQCDPNAMHISGKVSTKYKRAIPGAEVMVEAEGFLINSGMTNDNGIYGVGGISFDLGRPVVKAKVDDHTTKGLDALDLIYVLRHALGIEPLKQADQQAAADLNSDGTIDMDDYWDLADLIYDVPGREAQVEPWKFYDEKFGLFAGLRPDRLVEPIKLARYRHDYSLIGLKTGDVNFSWTNEDIAGNRSYGVRSDFSIQKTGGQLNYKIEIPGEGDVRTLALPVDGFDADLITSISVSGLDIPHIVTEINGREMLIVLSASDLSNATLEISASQEVSLDEGGLLFETNDLESGKTIDWMLRKVDEKLEQFDVTPNPFDDQFRLDLQSDANETATIEIMDAAGRLIITEKWSLRRGNNNRTINSDLLGSGLYLLSVQIDGQRMVRRIIKN